MANQIEHVSDLVLFSKIVELESLTLAGREMGLSPASASKRLTRLESALGARLITRTTRHVRPTEDGETFYQRAKAILSDVEAAEVAVSNATQEPRGHMRVSMPAGFGRAHVLPLLVDFAVKYPQVEIDVLMTDRVQDLVTEGVDVCVRVAELKDSSLVARKLAENRRLVCASPAYLKAHGRPKTPKDLQDHNCLVLHGQETWRLQGEDGAHTIRVTGSISSNNSEVLKNAAMAGVGVTLKSIWDVGAQIKTGELVPLLEDYKISHGVAIYAVYPSARHLTARSRALLDFLIDGFSPIPPWEREFAAL